MSSYVIIHDRVIILRILCEIDPITPSSLHIYSDNHILWIIVWVRVYVVFCCCFIPIYYSNILHLYYDYVIVLVIACLV